MEMQKFQGYSVINGCNHDVIVYSKEKMSRDRNGRWLYVGGEQPLQVIKRERALNASKSSHQCLDFGQVIFDLPDCINDMEYPKNQADIIIVSGRYAEGCKATFRYDWFLAFYDRLFTPITFYEEMKAGRKGKTRGCIGFKKVFLPFPPEAYLGSFDNISKLAALYSVKMYLNDPMYGVVAKQLNNQLCNRQYGYIKTDVLDKW